jgi:uncharacterized membrane protein (UPF0127 family)
MIKNLTRDTRISSHTQITRNSWQRMKGLLGRDALPSGEALVITHCQSIHMLFMKFPIDVIFCDDRNKVVGLCRDIKPYGFSPVFFKASYAIEVPAGSIASSGTQLGDQVQL